jgi:DNA-binding MarR family transcriptional regulator
LRLSLKLPRLHPGLRLDASRSTAAGHERGTERLTPHETVTAIALPPATRRGRKPLSRSVATPSEARLLTMLDRPRRATELAKLLGVTRERVRQLIFRLLALDFIRSADPAAPTSVVARKDDPSLLLRMEQACVLSRFPDDEATTLSRIVGLVHIPRERLTIIAEALREAGLIETAGTAEQAELYRLTPAGRTHWQRSGDVRKADAPPPPPLPFRSDRVRSVLACLASKGPIRTRDIGLELGIRQPSMNALMQYLKRKNAVRTQSGVRRSPYELTADGRRLLVEMQNRQAAPTCTALV